MTNWQTPGSLTSAANPGGTSSPRRITTERRSAIAALIALAANGVFVAGIVADIIGVVSVAILQEKRNLSPKVAAIPDTGPGIPGTGSGARHQKSISNRNGGTTMLKHRSRLIGRAGAVATVTAIAVSGAMTASAAPTAARAAVSGTEHFQMMTTTGTGSTGSVIASGVFTAPAVDHEHQATNTSTFTFANGTILIKHSNGTGTQHFDPKTCLMTINLHGTYKLLSGTGAYAGISGSGNYQLSILAIGASSGGKCVQNKPPVAFHQVINATGSVAL